MRVFGWLHSRDAVVGIMPAVCIYESLASQLEMMIFTGKITSGEAIPSVRAIAREHSTSVATAQKAIAVLVKRGLIARRSGQCFVVRGGVGLDASQRLELLKPSALKLVEMANGLCIDPESLINYFSKLCRKSL
jgi:GntR family transcriptional regulator